MIKYLVNYTQKGGRKIKNQLYTKESLAGLVKNLETICAVEIEIKVIDTTEEEYKQYA